MNVTDPSVIRRNEQANIVTNQDKQREETQRQQIELAILQTQKIQELEMKIQEQTANIVTDNHCGIPRQVLAPINTNTNGGTSTTSTVSKEDMMQMFAQFTKNFNPEQTKENNRQAPKKKNKFGAKFIPNDLGNGQRSKRRYPESTSYCPSHGYDIEPDHTAVTCSNRKAFHKEEATITNRMGGVSTNCHFHTE